MDGVKVDFMEAELDKRCNPRVYFKVKPLFSFHNLTIRVFKICCPGLVIIQRVTPLQSLFSPFESDPGLVLPGTYSRILTPGITCPDRYVP